MKLNDYSDKFMHFAVGSVIASASTMMFGPLVAAGAVIVIAVGKEIADYLSNMNAKSQGFPAPHGVEVLDALATILGGASVLLPLVI